MQWVNTWIRDKIVEHFGCCDDAEARARVDGLLRRLDPDTWFQIIVLATPSVLAFTAPGRTVYLSRGLLERCHDEALAMVIAHELAHHRLGHVRVSWRRLWPWRSSAQALARQDDELAADRHALETCLAAGFDAERCLQSFTVLAHDALERGDSQHVFGPIAVDLDDHRIESHPVVLHRERAAREHLARLRAESVGGAGAYREQVFRPHCGFCDEAVAVDCGHCARPLCTDHGSSWPSRCWQCRADAGPLCPVCERSEHCFACTARRTCVECGRRSRWRCRDCGDTFCAGHRPRQRRHRRRCGRCRNRDERPAVYERRRQRWLRAALFVTVIAWIIGRLIS